MTSPQLPSTALLTFERQGSKLQLNHAQLEAWFAHVAADQQHHSLAKQAQSSPDVANRLLSQFGIKSARDVIAFLQSPAGLIAQTILHRKVAEIIAMQEHITHQHHLKLARHRAIAFLILGLLHKKEEIQLKRLFAAIQKKIDEKLHSESKQQVTTPTPKLLILPLLEEHFNHYDAARESLQNELKIGERLAATLESEWLEFEKMVFLFHNEYAIYDHFLDDIHSIYTDKALDATLIEQKLSVLTDNYNQELQAINQLTETADMNDEPTLLIRLQENEARKLQIATLRNVQEAIPSDKKIIQKEGKCYLLPVSQSITDLSLEAQEGAHQAYLSLKPRLEATRSLVENARTLENARYAEQNASLSARTGLVQQEIRQFANQLTKIQASIAQVSILIDQARNQEQQTTPTLTLTPTSTRGPSPTPKFKAKHTSPPAASMSSYASCIYRLELCKLRNNPELQHNLSPQSLTNLNNKAPTLQQRTAAQQQLRPGVPMSALIAATILRYNDGALAQQMKTLNPNLSLYHSSHQLLTPFNTNPNKLKPS